MQLMFVWAKTAQRHGAGETEQIVTLPTLEVLIPDQFKPPSKCWVENSVWSGLPKYSRLFPTSGQNLPLRVSLFPGGWSISKLKSIRIGYHRLGGKGKDHATFALIQPRSQPGLHWEYIHLNFYNMRDKNSAWQCFRRSSTAPCSSLGL